MLRFMIINGPNLNLLGRREPEIYGSATYADLVKLISKHCKEMQVEICFVGCQGHLTGGDYVIFDNFKLTEESGSARLTCPFASIYR